MDYSDFSKTFEIEGYLILIFIDKHTLPNYASYRSGDKELSGYWVYLMARIDGMYIKQGRNYFTEEKAQKAVDEYTQEKAEKWYFDKKTKIYQL